MLKIIALTIAHKPSNHDNSYEHDNMLACAPGLYVYTHMYVYIHTHMPCKENVSEDICPFQHFTTMSFSSPCRSSQGRCCWSPVIVHQPLSVQCAPHCLVVLLQSLRASSVFGHRLGEIIHDNSVMSSRFASSFWMFHPCRFCFLPSNLAPYRRCIFWFALATTGIPKPVMRRWRKPSTRASQESWKMPKPGWGSGPIWSQLEQDSHQIEAYFWFRCWSHSED